MTASLPKRSAGDLVTVETTELASYRLHLGDERADRLITRMLDGFEPLIDRLASAAAAGDPEGVRRAAHDLIGVAGGLGLVEMVTALRHLENRAGSADRGALCAEVAPFVAARPAVRAAVAAAVDGLAGPED